ncbi:DUF4352 domain-containing protein [Oceanobacillus salinisoli]|uniref:DUF4352 domain-containing protein n=1 Tax=Oceanobacillus salinisoli TaxID=2678611 RepID=UPI0012E1E45A|nr:DUF4352 domain-containing protein [Oceanobacillus salinisoli]
MSKEKVKKPFYRKIWVWVVVLIIVIAIASGGNTDTETASTDEEANSEQNKNSSQETADNEETSEEITSAKIGEPAMIADVTFTVNEIEETNEIDSGNEFIENAETDGKFIVLDVTVQNDKSESITIDSSYFKIITGNNVEYDPVTSGEVMMAMGDDMNDFFLEQINPGLSKSGKVVFEVGADVDLPNAVMKAQTGFWGTESIEIDLGE